MPGRGRWGDTQERVLTLPMAGLLLLCFLFNLWYWRRRCVVRLAQTKWRAPRSAGDRGAAANPGYGKQQDAVSGLLLSWLSSRVEL